jgi:cytochrome c1
MESAFKFYSALLGLFVAIAAMIGFNMAVWGLHRQPTQPVWHVPGGHASQGEVLVRKYGCGACHNIPGVSGAVGVVGPRLGNMRENIYVGGVLPNTPENLVNWIADPKHVDPRTAMPDLGVTDAEARHIAAYLYGI